MSELIHFLVSGQTVIVGDGLTSSVVFRRGDTLEITDHIIELNTDREGKCALLLTADEQFEKWGSVRFAPGEFPATELHYEPNSFELRRAREAARQEAHRIADADKRMSALAGVEARFGPAPRTDTEMGLFYR